MTVDLQHRISFNPHTVNNSNGSNRKYTSLIGKTVKNVQLLFRILELVAFVHFMAFLYF